MQRITYVNPRGESVTLAASPPFLLSHIDGTGSPPVELKSTRSPYQDGSTFIRTQLAERVIEVDGVVLGRSRQEMYQRRQYLSRVLNPKLGMGKVVYTNDHRSYAIMAVPDGPIFSNRVSNHHLFTVNFICPDPYWMDENEIVKALKYETGGMEFPLRLPTEFAFNAYRGTFTNDGDVDAPLLVHYQGPAVNPIVSNETTGQFIKVNYELKETDVLQISTLFGKKRVEIVRQDGSRENVYHWIDLDSDFFQLIPGQNTLSYASDREDDHSKATVTIYWSNRYIGG